MIIKSNIPPEKSFDMHRHAKCINFSFIQTNMKYLFQHSINYLLLLLMQFVILIKIPIYKIENYLYRYASTENAA